MAYVNLLPWREKQRQYQKQQYLVGLVATAAIVGLVFWFIGQAIDQAVSHQNKRNQYLQQEISLLDGQIAEIQKIKESKNAIEQRMVLIEQLQASRNVSPIVLDELARLVPAGVSFRLMQRTGNHIKIDGTSDSNNHLSDFMRKLEMSTVFINPELSSIKADSATSRAINHFTLTFMISPTVAPPKVAINEGQNNGV